MASHWIRTGSVFRSVFAPILRATQYLSVGYWLNRLAAWAMKVEILDAPPWVSEVYLLGTLLIGVLAVFAPALGTLPTLVAVATVIAPMYFALDTLLFAARWLFTDAPPLISYGRALAGYLLNIAGVAIFFAAILLGSGCIASEGVDGVPLSPLSLSATALYSSLRTVVTIGPTGTKELPTSWTCGVLLMVENVIAYVLTVILIGALAGQVVTRRRLFRMKPVSPGRERGKTK